MPFSSMKLCFQLIQQAGVRVSSPRAVAPGASKITAVADATALPTAATAAIAAARATWVSRWPPLRGQQL
eukprot:CAMPEP_0172728164 /NCGR_PEP_ID=MMETSP1074-20121228/92089_1 /TAXON_ID=2916 /ORGANISM="Ceratium fusus, Strain PA161109" /LENGTH=69 /DNA_ID=CAMNT_0013555387 /DNA_START=204 /DNA_END=410 /DNA_ORIENTATION=-